MTQLESLRKRLAPRPEGRCLLGLSGGADSIGLACLLLPLREEGILSLEAVHVNHGLRGEEADGDELFVREFCGAHGIPLHTVQLNLRGRTDENAAREARYEAFLSILRTTGIPTLILAHQMEDQAETFLMRLLRGAGLEGLSGMRPRENRGEYTLLRPMLQISGQELRRALREEEISWREDASNREAVYFRNRIRGELIPLMEQLAPGAAGRIARTAERISGENDAAEHLAEELLKRAERPDGLDAETLLSEPEAIRRRALRIWWRRSGPTLEERALNHEQTLRLTALAEARRGTIINLPGGWRGRREKHTIRLMDPSDRTRNNRPKKEST